MMRRKTSLALLCGAASLVAAGSALAGGGTLDSNDADQDAGHPFIGDVKDKNGAPLPGAKITVNVKSFKSSLFLRADDQGHFQVRPFDKSIGSDDIEISCGMDGYKPYALNREPTGTGPHDAIEVICLLEKQ